MDRLCETGQDMEEKGGDEGMTSVPRNIAISNMTLAVHSRRDITRQAESEYVWSFRLVSLSLGSPPLGRVSIMVAVNGIHNSNATTSVYMVGLFEPRKHQKLESRSKVLSTSVYCRHELLERGVRVENTV
ncbi:unnamed protein product, partial [Brenthis ino]